ncbi:MAG: OmpA family protein [Kofleriaceae bacterium]|nr:OmpA family protein [Kofleriaceae bacterium]
MRTLLFGLVCLPGLAAANPFELGGAFGGHAFSGNVELGVADRMDEPGPSSAALLGARLAYPFGRRLAAEAEAMWIPTGDDVLDEEATVVGLRAHARVDLLTGRVRPFAVAGLGVHILRTSSPQFDGDTDRAYHWGGGVRFAVSSKLDLRFDARHLLVPDRSRDGATSDFELTAGVTVKLGSAARKLTAVASAPDDRDGDGIRDDVDRCVAKPEDRDGFEDDDGCPELDNDSDGLVDTADACPLVPEIKNGWADEDGCADEVIRELAGIGFELDSAKIDGASAPLLERAFQILNEHPTLFIEVSGHTSSDGDADRNFDLSLRRAQTVRDYLVKRGIAEKRILTVGHGAEVPIADNATEDGRRKNRRIEFRILRADEVP